MITAGDVLLRFNPREVRWSGEGVSGLGSAVSPEEASRHGVFCLAGSDRVRRFLQKPSIAVQDEEGAINAYGQSVLDMGVFSFDARTAVRLLELAEICPDGLGGLHWTGPVGQSIEKFGLDFTRDRLCLWYGDHAGELLRRRTQQRFSLGECRAPANFDAMHEVPCWVQIVKQCDSCTSGRTTRSSKSGQQLVRSETGFVSSPPMVLSANSTFDDSASISGGPCWVEGPAVARR